MTTLLDALRRPPPCACDCWNALTADERRQGIAALFRFDDAMRGWGYTPLYEPAAPALWREAQKRNELLLSGLSRRERDSLIAISSSIFYSINNFLTRSVMGGFKISERIILSLGRKGENSIGVLLF